VAEEQTREGEAAEHGGADGEGRRHLSLVNRLLRGHNGDGERFQEQRVMVVKPSRLGGFALLLCGCLIKQQASSSVCPDDVDAN
jgi:hypothetical protein